MSPSRPAVSSSLFLMAVPWRDVFPASQGTIHVMVWCPQHLGIWGAGIPMLNWCVESMKGTCMGKQLQK